MRHLTDSERLTVLNWDQTTQTIRRLGAGAVAGIVLGLLMFGVPALLGRW